MQVSSLVRPITRGFRVSSRQFSQFKLPDLDYDFGALAPGLYRTYYDRTFAINFSSVISGQIMELHHSKHHNAYVTNLNVAIAKLEGVTSLRIFVNYFLIICVIQSALKLMMLVALLLSNKLLNLTVYHCDIFSIS